jgi:hypothetical protein
MFWKPNIVSETVLVSIFQDSIKRKYNTNPTYINNKTNYE